MICAIKRHVVKGFLDRVGGGVDLKVYVYEFEWDVRADVETTAGKVDYSSALILSSFNKTPTSSLV